MKHLFHVPAGAGEGRAIPVEGLDEARRAGGWVWVDVAEFTPEEVAEVGGWFGLDALEVEDVLDWSRFPKVEERQDHTLVVGHELSALATDRIATVEYDVFIGDRFLVTFHSEDLPAFAWGREHAAQRGMLSGSGPDVLWARIAEVGAARYVPLVDGLEERIQELEHRAIAADPSVPGEVLALRRDGQTLSQVIAAHRDTFRSISTEEYPGVTRNGRRRLGHVYDDYSRLAHGLTAAPVLLVAVLESYRGTVAERANEVMKVLTVFAAIVLPLSLVSGIYGMNFANLPPFRYRWGWVAVVGVMFLLGWGLWVYFARRGFIRGPRVAAVPRVVGRGLVEFLKLTTKPATFLLDLGRGQNARRRNH